MTPTWFYITTRAPTNSDPGVIEEAYFVTDGGDVILTSELGTQLNGESVRRKLKEGEEPRSAAVSLLRQRVSKKINNFHRKLEYR